MIKWLWLSVAKADVVGYMEIDNLSMLLLCLVSPFLMVLIYLVPRPLNKPNVFSLFPESSYYTVKEKFN